MALMICSAPCGKRWQQSHDDDNNDDDDDDKDELEVSKLENEESNEEEDVDGVELPED